MEVCIGKLKINIEKKIFEYIFENSWLHWDGKYQKALAQDKVDFKVLIELSRKADVPYTLFFAPWPLVLQCVNDKNKKLLNGISLKRTLCLNSRGKINLWDVELIIKDLLRKRELLKRYIAFPANSITCCLKGSKETIQKQAVKIKELLGFNDQEIIVGTKQKTYQNIIALLEKNNIFVSESSRSYMLQLINPKVRFSGFCIKDKELPYIFLNNKEDFEIYEPEGRRIFTLILMVVCLAKGKFLPIKFNEQTKRLIQNSEYEIAEEILTPKESFKQTEVKDLDDIVQLSKKYSVTPSAIVMRLRRLGIIKNTFADQLLEELKNNFNSSNNKSGHPLPPHKETGYKKYNGLAFSKYLLSIFDQGKIGHKEVFKTLFNNRERSMEFLYNYREKYKI